MGVTYQLINRTKGERISYLHLPAGKARELAGNPAAAAITTWYLLQTRGDDIAFVSDESGDWPFSEGEPREYWKYRDVTDDTIEQLIQNAILVDEGKEYYFDDEPEVYHRKLFNIWMEGRT